MLKVLFAAVLLLHLVSSAIHVKNGRLVDDTGGQLIFHGLNLVSKTPPYHTKFNETDMQLFQELGINGIRLGVMWPGVEPTKGQFNETYLQLMRQTVQDSAKYGIYTLVQFHQDLFSQKFCADGVPVWAIPHEISKDFPRPLNVKKFKFQSNGFPRWQDCAKHSWSQYYFSNSVAKGFGSLWNNRHGMRDMFINYWRKVAYTFKSSQHVIAYQLINQPWPGDQFLDPLVMVPGLSQSINMQDAYDIIARKIREVDPDHSICFQPVTWLNYFRSGFRHPPGGLRYANTSIFCYHYYQPPTFNLKKFMKARMKDVKRLQTGGLLSQFYVIDQMGVKNVEMMNSCDDNLQSWFGWLYNIEKIAEVPKQVQSQHDLHSILYNDDGTVDSRIVEGVTRTYAPRVAGTTISQKYNPLTKKFTLVYDICTVCGHTSIFVSKKYIYKKGYTLKVYPEGGVKVQEQGEHHVKLVAGHVKADTRISVTITAL